MKQIIFLLLISLFLYSCEEKPETPQVSNERSLIISVVPNAIQANVKAWAILHDLNGTPLDFKKVENGSSENFKITESTRYHLTFYRVAESPNGKSHVFTSYTDILPGETINLGLRPQSNIIPSSVGTFKVIVDIEDFGGDAFISHNSGYSTSIYGFGEKSFSDTEIILQPKFFPEESEYLLVALGPDGRRKELNLSNIAMGETYEFKFSALPDSNWDQLTVPSAEFGIGFSVYEMIEVNNSWYRQGKLISSSNTNPFPGTQPPRVFYNPNHEVFRTEASTSVSSQNGLISVKTFFQVGSMPDQITFPAMNDFQVADKTFGSFNASVPSGATDWLIQFSIPASTIPLEAIRGEIYGSNNSFSLQFPEELIAEYPFLSSLNTSSAESITVNFRNTSYDEYLSGILEERPILAQPRYTSIIKNLNID